MKFNIFSILLYLYLGSAIALGAPLGPTDNDSRMAKAIVTHLLPKHVTRRALDDEISKSVHWEFLSRLDPQKLFFDEGLLLELSEVELLHDNLVKAGDVNFPFVAFEPYLMRRQAYYDYALTILNDSLDVRKKSVFQTEYDEIQPARTLPELKRRWQNHVRFRVQRRMKAGKSKDEAIQAVRETLEREHKYYGEMKGSELVEIYFDALMRAYDPHSSFMSAQTMEQFQIQMRGSLEGIGASLSVEEGYIQVNEVMKGSGAEAAGLKAGDKITAISEDGTSFVDIVGEPLSEVVGKIRGPEGTFIFLSVESGSSKKTLKIERKQVDLEGAKASGHIKDIEIANGMTKRIGVLHLPTFYADREKGISSARDVKEILLSFVHHEVDGVIFDLRNNGGGSLNDVQAIGGFFLGHVPITQVYGDNIVGDGPLISREPKIYDGPLIVLTNKASASASEIFAAAIRDYERGVIIGDESTHGKGSVQRVIDLDEGAAGKVTIQGFFSPLGRSNQVDGVPSDIVLPTLLSVLNPGESALKNALRIPDVPPAIRLPELAPDHQRLIAQLLARHERRLARNPDLMKAGELLKKARELSEVTTIELSGDDLKAASNAPTELETIQSQLVTLGAYTNEEPENFGTDSYSGEIIRIMLDYLLLEPSQIMQPKRGGSPIWTPRRHLYLPPAGEDPMSGLESSCGDAIEKFA